MTDGSPPERGAPRRIGLGATAYIGAVTVLGLGLTVAAIRLGAVTTGPTPVVLAVLAVLTWWAGPAVVYGLAGRKASAEDLVGAGEIIRHVGGPVLAADVVQVVVNLLLRAGIVRLTEGVPMRVQIIRLARTTSPAYLGYGIVAFLLVVLWQPAGLGPAAAVLVLAPL